MSLTDILIVALFAVVGGSLVLLSTRLRIGGCRPCRARQLDAPPDAAPNNPHNPIGPAL
jgi:hypothetical protein